MRILIRLSLRNIFRHKKRSLITLAAIAVGLGALIFMRSFMHGAHIQMVRNVTRTLTSDAQIVPAALENFYNTNGAIEDPEPIREMLRSDPRVVAYSERVIGGGMISSEKKSMATFIIGFDPGQEEKIGTRREVTLGRPLAAGDEQGVVLGEKMRQILGAEIGESIVLTAQDFYGSLTGERFTLLGTFETGNDQVDNSMVILLKSSAQRLLSFEQRISKFALKIDPDSLNEEVVQDLRAKIGNSNLKVVTWQNLIPMIAQMIQFQNGMSFIIMAIVLSVVAAGILNTLMMSIVERIREFGLMMALGTTPSRIILLIVFESFFLSISGAFGGLLLGAGLAFYFGHVGINLTRFVSALSNLMIGSHVFPRFDLYYSIIFLVVVLLSNLLVSLYPAWKAGRLVPLDAMRQT
ncbi:MAG: ABC transporter permease [Deltaproteobacteria bacterium]|nr:ABC transporter permease [Deltaproteobacteria bacterium]